MWKHSFFLLLLLASAPAIAAENPEGRLQAVDAELARAQERDREIGERGAAMEAELKDIRSQLVSLTERLQKSEKSLLESEEKLRTLKDQQQKMEEKLEGQRQKLQAMVSSAIRLSQTPPEAAVMMPGDFDKAAKAARVLSALTRRIRAEAAAISRDMRELSVLAARVQRERDAQLATRKELKERQEAVDSALKERSKLARAISREQAETRRQIADLSRQSKDLRGLIAGLEQQRKEQEEKARREGKAKKIKEKTQDISRLKGGMRLPAAGRVIRDFGDPVGKNATSKGMVLRARPGGAVVAPYAGEVVFAGPFLDYGRMVILRHREDFHTLLAGFSRIDVGVGEFLLEGEPIGAMGTRSDDTDLYMELRSRGQPVDPASWIRK